jgi:uncharacterized protein YjiS (DUF1127 family)
MPQNELETLALTYRRRSPADHTRIQHLVVERAKALRIEFLREMWRQFVAWQERRSALAQLRALDDVALKDIGLHRSGIEAAVDRASAKPAPRKGPAFPQKPHLCLHRS